MSRQDDHFGPMILAALRGEFPDDHHDRRPLPLRWKVFCAAALLVGLTHIALTVLALTGGTP